MSFRIFFCVLFALVAGVARSVYTTISTSAEFKAFADEVGTSTSYKGLTVSLAADIDLAGISYTPIGGINDDAFSYNFQGTFEGNGHVIKNMIISSSELYYVGLFGYSNGCTIRNVVIDSSCSLTNTKLSNYNYAGGIIGYANTGGSQVNILNCVNMATITGEGKISRMGGIAGMAYGFLFSATIANCVNMGAIVHEGTDSKLYVGGIVGFLTGQSDVTTFVHNCVNMAPVASSPQNTGAIAGSLASNSHTVTRNYWLAGTSATSYYGATSESGNEVFSSGYKLASGEPLASKLNSFVSESELGLRSWATVTLDANGGSLAAGSEIAMLVLIGTPGVPSKEQGTFEGWFTDSTLTKKWSKTTIFDGNATLYAKWTMNRFTISFNTSGDAEIAPVTAEYGSTIQLEMLSKIGHTFVGWADEKGNIFTESYTINRAENVMLTAQWTTNMYTVSFNTSDDAEITPATAEYGSTIQLEMLSKVGYTFVGWTDEMENVFTESYTINMADNVTLTAQWTTNMYTVSFNTSGDAEIAPVTAEYGSTIQLEVLSKVGYTFVGWADDKGNIFTESYTINMAENVTLTAQWEQIKYSVSFVCDGNVTNIFYVTGENITAPAVKVDEEHILDGWFTDADFTNKFVLPAVMGTENITLYAKLVEKSDYAKIQFGKVLSKAEQDRVIKAFEDKYGGRMEIIEFDDSNEQTSIIVRFVDPLVAEELYEEYQNGNDTTLPIKRIDFLERGSFGKRNAVVLSLLALLI